MPEDSAFETMKLEYIALRQEILQSISYQHQILLAGYGATGVFAGYVVVKPFPASYLAALIIIPFILLGMASLWIVECNRMVRASYYIGRILWPCLRDECTSKPRNQHLQEVGWECWIRSKNKKDEASRFRERQHRSQCIVVFLGSRVPEYRHLHSRCSGRLLDSPEINCSSASVALGTPLSCFVRGRALDANALGCHCDFRLRGNTDSGYRRG